MNTELKIAAEIYASTRALSLFSYQDRSSEEIIKINRRLGITTENWQSVKQQFIEERYSRRLHEAWSRFEWATEELDYLERIDFSESQDRQVLKERYTKELSKIVKVSVKTSNQKNKNQMNTESKEVIFIQITTDQLAQIIETKVLNALNQWKKSKDDEMNPNNLITRREASNLLGISLPTLGEYCKRGLIPSYKIGKNVRFKRDELIKCLIDRSEQKQ
jgi:excisionase family DNA binding protein